MFIRRWVLAFIMSWLDDYEAPHFRTKKPINWKPYVSGLIVILLIIAVVYYFVTKPVVEETIVPEETSQPSETTETVASPVFKSSAPPFDSKCTVVAGVIPGSINNVDGEISFTFKNNGKINIEGSYFEASNQEVKAYRQNTESLEPGKEITYSIDLNDVSTEVGIAVKSFVVLPVQNGKACLNQRMIVIG